ncbi:MAG: hypothetical protein AAF703_22605, partial [Cyanobacteria bacterium P01_D01_bin.105]
ANAALSDTRSQLEQLPLFLSPPLGRQVASSEQLSPTHVSEPSLSWIREQLGKRYGSDRLVVQWHAYQASTATRILSYVDVIVDEQIWSLLSYFERYAFIAQFGTAAKQYGYHLRVFHSGDLLNYDEAQTIDENPRLALRGAYICNFLTPDHTFPDYTSSDHTSPDRTAPSPISPDRISEIPCDILLNEVSRREIR